MKLLSWAFIVLFIGAFIVTGGWTMPANADQPIFNGGYACMSGNDRVHPNCGATPTPPPVVPSYNGCQVFPAGDPTWNTNVSATAADAGNAGYMTTMLAAGTAWQINASHSATFWDINQANSGNSTQYTLTDTSFVKEFNITNARFNSSFGWQGKGISSDHHLMVVSNVGQCSVLEAFSSMDESSLGPSWSPAPNPNATALVDVQNRKTAMWYPLNLPFPTPMPTGGVTGTVTWGGNPQLGGPVFPGLVRWEDFQNNTPHALAIDGPHLFTLNNSFVYPAKLLCGVCGSTAGLPPMGAHVVMLPAAIASVACYNATPSLSTCPEASFIMNCLLQSGAYFMDQTTATNTGFTLRLGNTSAGADPWTDVGDLNNLHSIAVNATNFKFIPPPFSGTRISNCLNSLNPAGC